MTEAVRLFTVSTMDAARSGIYQLVNITPEMANEIKVLGNYISHLSFLLSYFSIRFIFSNVFLKFCPLNSKLNLTLREE